MTADVVKLGVVLSDRGSKYAVSGAVAASRSEVDAVLKALKRDKSYAKATHNTWGVILPGGTPLKGDDGEVGAGMVILRMLERANIEGHVVIVTRWYGGKHLGGDRFRHVQTCVSQYLDAQRNSPEKTG
ncbi:MAG: YigZ family protein [Sulfitobacter sp.]